MDRTRIVIYFLAHKVRPDIAGWSSLVARRAHNPEVVGSNPAPATKNFVDRKLNGFRAFCLLVYLAGESPADHDSIKCAKQINH